MSALQPLIGHEATRASLANAHHVGSLPRTLLLHGPAGVGKQRLALWLAQLLVCESPEAAGEAAGDAAGDAVGDAVGDAADDPAGACGRCPQCRQALKLEHPDVHWHFPVARPRSAGSPEKLRAAIEKERGSVLADRRQMPLYPAWNPEVRGIYVAAVQTIRQQATKKPSAGPRQVFIIGDAEWLVPQEASPEAANALLKLLEEPPEGTTFVLTTSEPQKLLPTIRSRATAVHVGRLAEERVANFLVEATGCRPEDAGVAARLGNGAIGQALGYLDADGEPGPLEAIRRDALALMEAALDSAPEVIYGAGLARSPAGGRALTPLLGELCGWLRDLAAAGSGVDELVFNVDERDRLCRLAAATAPDRIANAIDRVEEARWMAQGNVNPQLVVFGLVHELREDLGVAST